MKPAPFDYVAPESLQGALAALGEHGADAKLLAGGQSLIPVMNFRLAQPAVLIDLNRVPGLDGIETTSEGGLRIGALCRHSAVEKNPQVAQVAPLLHEAVPFIAHPQIRNRGTVGGSLAHADPAAELPAVTVAARARLKLQSAEGERWLAASEFFTGLFATALEPDEILVEIELPPAPPGAGWSFQEIARRHGDYAQVGVAAMVSLATDGTCRESRLVYLSVGDGPIEARQAADLLAGQALSEDTLESAAAHAATQEIEPTDDIHASAEFKRHLARVLSRRALTKAAERARAVAERS
jgi:carbon-monoxide dehydrogenase medium subunit